MFACLYVQNQFERYHAEVKNRAIKGQLMAKWRGIKVDESKLGAGLPADNCVSLSQPEVCYYFTPSSYRRMSKFDNCNCFFLSVWVCGLHSCPYCTLPLCTSLAKTWLPPSPLRECLRTVLIFCWILQLPGTSWVLFILPVCCLLLLPAQVAPMVLVSVLVLLRLAVVCLMHKELLLLCGQS